MKGSQGSRGSQERQGDQESRGIQASPRAKETKEAKQAKQPAWLGLRSWHQGHHQSPGTVEIVWCRNGGRTQSWRQNSRRPGPPRPWHGQDCAVQTWQQNCRQSWRRPGQNGPSVVAVWLDNGRGCLVVVVTGKQKVRRRSEEEKRK